MRIPRSLESVMSQPQLVYMGQTHSGQKGLFTAGWLAMPLTDEKWELFNRDWRALDAYCERCGFVYDWFHHHRPKPAVE